MQTWSDSHGRDTDAPPWQRRTRNTCPTAAHSTATSPVQRSNRNTKQGCHSFGYKKFQDFSLFPGPCRKPAMFKYRDKQQLLKLLSFYNYLHMSSIYTSYCRIFWSLHPHHCVRTSAQQIPGLSRTKLIFQDFPGQSWKKGS